MRITPLQVLSWLRRAVAAEWQGPPDLPRSLTLEWRFMSVRWVGVLCVTPVLPLLHLSPTRLVGAYAIVATAIAYNLSVRWFLTRRPQLFANGYLTTLADSILNTSMVLMGGGFDSPFSYILFSVTIAVAMRYGYGPAVAMSGLFVFFDAVESAWNGQTPDAAFAFRGGF